MAFIWVVCYPPEHGKSFTIPHFHNITHRMAQNKKTLNKIWYQLSKLEFYCSFWNRGRKCRLPILLALAPAISHFYNTCRVAQNNMTSNKALDQFSKLKLCCQYWHSFRLKLSFSTTLFKNPLPDIHTINRIILDLL